MNNEIKEIPKDQIRYDEQRIISLVHTLPDYERNHILNILSKLVEYYNNYQEYLKYLDKFCDEIVKNSQYFKQDKK